MEKIIFTDLDGTLLDQNYSYAAALSEIKLLKKRNVPIVICSSKTRAEVERYRDALKINDPFIVENGGAIFIEKNYFSFPFDYDRIIGKYQVIELGTPYPDLRRVLEEARRATGCSIKGFGDMAVKEIAEDSGLDLDSAPLAKKREYDEPFKIYGSKKEKQQVLAHIERKGLNCSVGGRYYHLMGGSDKGKGVWILAELFRKKFKAIKTIAIGDALNDLPMLQVVDVPVLVQKPDGSWDPAVKLPNIHKVHGVGPKGWSKIIKKLIG